MHLDRSNRKYLEEARTKADKNRKDKEKQGK